MAGMVAPLASTFYRGSLPSFVWAGLEQLYHSSFCSHAHLEASGALGEVPWAWVARRDGQVVAVLLFVATRGTARVLNEVVTLEADCVEQFAQDLFRRFPRVGAIVLHAVELRGRCTLFPQLGHVCSEDFVLVLPSNRDDWLAGLSRQAREKLRYYHARCRRREPGLSFDILRGEQVGECHVQALLALSRARMEKKGVSFGIGSVEQGQLLALARARGMLVLLTLDGRICAGLLCSVTGDDVFMHVVAHDPTRDDLRLGLVACSVGIAGAIAAGHARFHFLWGRYDYKLRLGGRERPLSSMVVYRNRLHGLLHPLLAWRQLTGRARRALAPWWRRIRNIRQDFGGNHVRRHQARQ